MKLYRVYYNTICVIINANDIEDVKNVLLESYPDEFKIRNDILYHGIGEEKDDIVSISDITHERYEVEKDLLRMKNEPGYVSGINYYEGFIERGVLYLIVAG